jgi:TonB family protein
MTRLETKCLLASASAHGLMVMLLVLAPLLWVRPKPTLTFPELKLIPSRLLDGATGGGGSPTAKPAEPAPAPAPAPARPAQPQVLVVPPPPLKAPTIPAKEQSKLDQAEPEVVPKKKKAAPVPTDKKVPVAKADESIDANEVMVHGKKMKLDYTKAPPRGHSNDDSVSQSKADRRDAAQAFATQVGRMVNRLGQGLSTTGTSVDVPGPGGEVYADYSKFVIAVYRAAWIPPSDMSEDKDTVRVRVVIRRDGTVESFQIITSSGNAAVDKSVEHLRKIQSIGAAFPEGAPNEKRMFNIRFNLRPDSE